MDKIIMVKDKALEGGHGSIYRNDTIKMLKERKMIAVALRISWGKKETMDNPKKKASP